MTYIVEVIRVNFLLDGLDNITQEEQPVLLQTDVGEMNAIEGDVLLSAGQRSILGERFSQRVQVRLWSTYYVRCLRPLIVFFHDLDQTSGEFVGEEWKSIDVLARLERKSILTMFDATPALPVRSRHSMPTCFDSPDGGSALSNPMRAHE